MNGSLWALSITVLAVMRMIMTVIVMLVVMPVPVRMPVRVPVRGMTRRTPKQICDKSRHGGDQYLNAEDQQDRSDGSAVRDQNRKHLV